MAQILGIVRVVGDDGIHRSSVLGIRLGAGGIAAVDIDQLAIEWQELDFLDGHIHIGGKSGCINGNLIGHGVFSFFVCFLYNSTRFRRAKLGIDINFKSMNRHEIYLWVAAWEATLKLSPKFWCVFYYTLSRILCQVLSHNL